MLLLKKKWEKEREEEEESTFRIRCTNTDRKTTEKITTKILPALFLPPTSTSPLTVGVSPSKLPFYHALTHWEATSAAMKCQPSELFYYSTSLSPCPPLKKEDRQLPFFLWGYKQMSFLLHNQQCWDVSRHSWSRCRRSEPALGLGVA